MRASADGPGGRGTGGGVARESMCRGGACRGGARDESASELSEQFGNADGDQAECGGAAVAGALPGGCRNPAQVTIHNCRIRTWNEGPLVRDVRGVRHRAAHRYYKKIGTGDAAQVQDPPGETATTDHGR